ncbi:Type I restriction enzyme EcoR124II R protein [Fusobacterium polymorphum]|uniref:Type I restriction enzyme endonuclease subunit n=2 Tax=Fusobacterium nucleatum subsp. polymorphum TaxID=76857 RepID=A5TWU6_FUSNP|nr:type I restriction endonuclease subunit R [Fusobacterium polymorphum]EDK89371.1 type I site-specific deoxyribonuclease restriction subunit [Fusobacterium polymorphum ATCC 10953]OWP26355.1 DEAD/DEAH box helicase [Fusobacterium polymorphum]UTI52803.1 type I restriction endonuclease subunit R [Fusobacterium polymorphum]WRL69550.1 type I restriction endonuclease subunit R [Fusobacterium polymorphum]CKH13657.1 Type I restriction enzyme EcoR124II R protein [Fusobacterium polymorphum]
MSSVDYNMLISTLESTVVTEYVKEDTPVYTYQSEADLEREFIKNLQNQGYEYLIIHNEKELIANLKGKLEKLNNIIFSEKEWERFFKEKIANKNESIIEKTRTIQEDYIKSFTRDNGTLINIFLIDKKNIHNNFLQVINQYEEENGNHNTRYDVSILVNGLPLIHIELKRRGVAIREAFNQINRYQRDSFWAGSGLFEYVQIFVISNGTNTKYYSNTTRARHIKEMSYNKRKVKKSSNSFEFTSYWADANNKAITDLVDFTKTFFAKHTILNVLTKYCIFDTSDTLLVMRPYQISATERILSKIQLANNYKWVGKIDAGGYIWHTTGSGKTLTSFKTAQLASQLDYIDKVLFVVDRKDLDSQTQKEYDRFSKGSANGNTSTKILKAQLEDRYENKSKIIITTIQKLGHFIKQNKNHEVFKKNIVLIFDECHRSQFGELHLAITKTFKNYFMFGFTGTPIFPKNSNGSSKTLFKTTEQTFGDKLHTYTIVNAINDGNVLPFRIDYINTIKEKENIQDKKVNAIDIEKAMSDPNRIREIVSYIIDHFEQKTMRNKHYELKDQRLSGFNSIFAVSSIPVAKKYYLEFKKQLEEKNKNLSIATIFSYSANEEENTDNLDDESFDTENLDLGSREFLEEAILDYNKKFGTNFDTSADGFQLYYEDLSKRTKNKEIDILIVVNMFLTGFDATTLNTLWVDKNLRMHGLIQAFSRTNRILNSIKTFGNIICFRDLQNETDEAIALFGNKEAGGIVLLKTYEEYYNGYEDDKGREKEGYSQLIKELQNKFPIGEQIIGEQNEKEFIILFGNILKIKNILSAFDKFTGNEILSEREYQDYQSIYIDLYEEIKKTKNTDKESINDDVIFEIELIKQVEINIDYILMKVAEYYKSNKKDKEILIDIKKAIDSSIELRSKKELIEGFIDRVNSSKNVTDDFKKFVREEKEKDLEKVIEEEKLKPEETKKFIDNSLRDGTLKTTGTDIDKLLPPVSRFGGGNRIEKKLGVIEKLKGFFDKYLGLTI